MNAKPVTITRFEFRITPSMIRRQVVTTQRHVERWQRTRRGWRIFLLREFGEAR